MSSVVSFKQPDPDAPFIIGSTVALKGGGAVMTVRKAGKASVTTDWHDSNDNLCSADFPPAMLRHADPNEADEKATAAE